MAMSNPIISIITPTFNRSIELEFLIQSINKQTLDNKYFEMIICDDGSTDDTYDRIKKWSNEVKFSLKYFKQNKIVNAEKEYKNILPNIVFIMQSIDSLICYGKRVCAFRMGVKNVYDREPFLRPSSYGVKKSKDIANSLGYF